MNSRLDNRNSLIKRIHTVKRELALDDDTYRTILRSISGKESCRDLDLEYLGLVNLSLRNMLDRMKLGGASETKNAAAQKKISKLGYLLDWNWTDIAGFCFKQTGKKSTRQCDASELTKIINGMIYIINDRITNHTLVLSDYDYKEFLKNTQSESTITKETL